MYSRTQQVPEEYAHLPYSQPPKGILSPRAIVSRSRFGPKDQKSRVTEGVQSLDPIPSNTVVQPRAPGKLACSRFSVSIVKCERVDVAPNYHRIDLLLQVSGGPMKYVISTPHTGIEFKGVQIVEKNETRALHLESVNTPVPSPLYIEVQAVGEFMCPARRIQLPC